MSDRDEVVADVENELTLLSRYHAHAQRAGFQLDRSAYLLLGRLELEHPLSLKQLAEARSGSTSRRSTGRSARC